MDSAKGSMSEQRVVALIDMDCFYVQVEQRDRPELWGKPVVVVQYNQYRRGGIIAVGYEARAKGVKRNGMRGLDAQQLCPDVHLVQVPVSRGKANLTKYRSASAEVFKVLASFPGVLVERASIDEAYVDLTAYVNDQALDADGTVGLDDLPDTHVFLGKTDDDSNRQKILGDWLSTVESGSHDARLLKAAAFVEKMRKAILERTQFRCSAGIAHNKMVAKLACGLHKPKQQTILPLQHVPQLWEQTPIRKVRNLGGKFGAEVCERFGIEKMSELMTIPPASIKSAFGDKNGAWLCSVAQGMDAEPVKEKDLLRSIGCGKNFMGREALTRVEDVHFWLSNLAEELMERLAEDKLQNHRVARTVSVGIRTRATADDMTGVSSTRAITLVKHTAEYVRDTALRALKEFNVAEDGLEWKPHIINLGLFASRFEDSAMFDSLQPITQFFKPGEKTSKGATPTSSGEASCSVSFVAQDSPAVCSSDNPQDSPAHRSADTPQRGAERLPFSDGNTDDLSMTQEFHDEIQGIEDESDLVDAIARKTGSIMMGQFAADLRARNRPSSRFSALESLLLKRSRTFRALRSKNGASTNHTVAAKKLLQAKRTLVKKPIKQKVSGVERWVRRGVEAEDLFAEKSKAKTLPSKASASADAAQLAANPLRHTLHTGTGMLPRVRLGKDDVQDGAASCSNPIEVSDVHPVSLEDIDPEVLAALPESVKLELAAHYRSNQSQVQVESSSAAGCSKNDNLSVISSHITVDDCSFDHSAATSEPITDVDLDPVSMDCIDSDVLAALPEHVRLELFARYRVVRPRVKSTVGTSKSRKGKRRVEDVNRSSRPRGISAFFGNSS